MLCLDSCHLHQDHIQADYFLFCREGSEKSSMTENHTHASQLYLILKNPSGAPSTSVPAGIRPVTHLFLSEVTSDSVMAAWSAPAPPADLFILSYSSSDGTDTSKVTLDGSKTASLIQGLLPSTPYTVSLITIQADVTSDPISASLITGETPRETRVRTRKSLVKGRDGEKLQ